MTKGLSLGLASGIHLREKEAGDQGAIWQAMEQDTGKGMVSSLLAWSWGAFGMQPRLDLLGSTLCRATNINASKRQGGKDNSEFQVTREISPSLS